MDKRKIIPLFVVGALALAALGAFAVRSVYAQAPTPTPSAPSSTAPDGQAFPGKGMRGHGPEGFGGGVTDADLASALGIDVTKLQAAYQTAQAEALKQAVSQGLLTQEQADQITANGAGRFMFGDRWLKGSNIDVDALLANALGISKEDLQAARVKAFSTAVDRAVTNGAITQEQADLMKGQQALANDSKFQSSMQSAYEAAIAQAVKDGVITQAQADQILAKSANKGLRGWGPGFGGGMRGFEGRGHHGLPGTVAPDDSNSNPSVTPSTPSSGGA